MLSTCNGVGVNDKVYVSNLTVTNLTALASVVVRVCKFEACGSGKALET